MVTLVVFFGTFWNRGSVCAEANRGSDTISLPPIPAFPWLLEPSGRFFFTPPFIFFCFLPAAVSIAVEEAPEVNGERHGYNQGLTSWEGG
ncbi:hypothetical protein LINGRAHAP2_LOCUS31124 [Linum grandiflorum]